MVVYGKPGCSACERVAQWLAEASRTVPLFVERRDIAAKPEWHERHRYRVPVIEIAGQERLALKFTQEELFAALSAAAQERRS